MKPATTSAILFGLAAAQYFPPAPSGLTTLQSAFGPGVTISYKQAHICETTPGVRSWSGYVNFPAEKHGLFTYNTSTFFWFFESRHSPATSPLVMWVAGGPGFPSTSDATLENGPCYINPDSNSTDLNPWSRNNYANVLYVDQPTGTGFSYSGLVNGTYDQITQVFTPQDFSKGGVPEQNETSYVGTFSTSYVDTSQAANTSATAAQAMWRFLQVWMQDFHEYNSKSNNNQISFWANSYGGYFSTAYSSYILTQNKRIIRAGNKTAHQIAINLQTLGLENSCLDIIPTASSYATIAYNNTYGLQMIDKKTYKQALGLVEECVALTQQCREVAEVGDPREVGSNETVNGVCAAALPSCGTLLALPTFSNRNVFDMADLLPGSQPPSYSGAFFNQHWVQAELGVPVNFSYTPNYIANAFFPGTVDAARWNGMSKLSKLLNAGVNVAMVYGDRDTRCNWIGAEAISLTVPYASARKFRSSGYADISSQTIKKGGVVRQYNTFSMSRVFEAGHAVSYYQPELTFTIFNRTMSHLDVSTGKIPTLPSTNDHSSQCNYASKGPASSWSIKNKLPASAKAECQIWNVPGSCSEGQIEALRGGTAVVRDYVVVEPGE